LKVEGVESFVGVSFPGFSGHSEHTGSQRLGAGRWIRPLSLRGKPNETNACLHVSGQPARALRDAVCAGETQNANRQIPAVRGHGILKDRAGPMRIMGSGWFVRSNLDPDLEKPLAEGRTERNCEPGFLTRPGAPGPVSVTTTPGRVLVRRRSVTSRLQLRRSRRGTLFTEAPRRSR
jgi:hypothetical protein